MTEDDDSKASGVVKANAGASKLVLGVKKKLTQNFGNVRSRSGTTVEIRKKKGGQTAATVESSDASSAGGGKLTRDEQLGRVRALRNFRDVSSRPLQEGVDPRGSSAGGARPPRRGGEDRSSSGSPPTSVDARRNVMHGGATATAGAFPSRAPVRGAKGAGLVSTKVLDESEKQRVKKRSNRPRDAEMALYEKHSQLAIDAALDENADPLILKAEYKKKSGLHKKDHQEEVKRIIKVSGAMDIGTLSAKLSTSKKVIVQMVEEVTGDNPSQSALLEPEVIELISEELGWQVLRDIGFQEADLEEGYVELNPEPRAPIVTIMGHVDHGKTTLLDALRETSVAQGEHGGITQNIGAYQFKTRDGRSITMIDTPGHAAFTAMRARGASLTDIVIIVVAADDGVKEQTIEAINHAKAAEVSIIVAINKIDKPDLDIARVKSELYSHGLILEDAGGDVPVVEISAKIGKNLDSLEETILLTADLMELKADPKGRAVGVVLESRLDKRVGALATVVVQKGSLKNGDVILVRGEHAKVRSMVDCNGKRVNEAGPSMPVEVLGLKTVPEPGKKLFVMRDDKEAKSIISRREKAALAEASAAAINSPSFSIEDLFAETKQAVVFIVRADTQGAVDAVMGCMESIGLAADAIEIKVIHKGVGGVTESDINLASTTGAYVVAFGVRVDRRVKDISNELSVKIVSSNIIYDLVDYIKGVIKGEMKPLIKEEIVGIAEVRQVFNVTKAGRIAGCYVREGVVKRAGVKARLMRDSAFIYEGVLKGLKRFKDDAKEVKANYECGIMLDKYDDIKPGDLIEIIETIEQAPEL